MLLSLFSMVAMIMVIDATLMRDIVSEEVGQR